MPALQNRPGFVEEISLWKCFLQASQCCPVRPKTSLILHTTLYSTNELTHSRTYELSTSSFLTPSEGCPKKMKCSESCQWQTCTERGLCLCQENPELVLVCLLLIVTDLVSSSAHQVWGDWKHRPKHKQRVNMLEITPRATGKTREIFTHHEDTPCNKNSLNFPQARWVLYPGEAQCEPRSIFTTSRALVGTPWHSAIFPLSYFYCPWKRSSSARNPCEEQPSKTTSRTWQKATCKARKCLMELEAWDTLIQLILLLEEWELCE